MSAAAAPVVPKLELLTGTVYRKSRGLYGVRADGNANARASDSPLLDSGRAIALGQLVECELSSRLRKHLEYPTAVPTSLARRVRVVHDIRVVDPVAVGDRVHFVSAGDGTGLIVEVLPRRNQLVRRDPGPKVLEQVIAANLDQIVHIVAAASPPPKWELLDRFLVAAEMAEIPSLILLTKLDLDDHTVVEEVENYRTIGYSVVMTSAATGQGIEEVKRALVEKASVMVGKSGVGKSTLLNALQPGLGLATQTISRATGKGRHTTSHLEMYDLEFGGRIVDTPGLKYLTLWRAHGAGIAEYFVEMREHLGACRFGASCTHDHEPGCAIKDAVERGAISPQRYKSFLHISGSGRSGMHAVEG